MRGFFYSRLSLTNIFKNKRVFAPYIIVSSFMVMIFCLIFNVEAFIKSGSFGFGARSIAILFDVVRKVMYLFSLIVLLYTNSFVMKQRFKELGLYSILGMNKVKLSRLMLLDSFFAYVISMVLGAVFALSFSRLSLLIFSKMTGLEHGSIGIGFVPNTVVFCGIFFLVIFLLSTLFNLIRMVFLKPLNIMKIQSAGEKEPKGNVLLGLLGLVALGFGYYIALKDHNIFAAFQLFLPAVLLVVIGTYLTFVSFSVVLLKYLKNRRQYYYKKRNFLNVSTMLYRMKKNAVGLANICLLSTMALVTISGCVGLYSGVKNTTNAFIFGDVRMNIGMGSRKEAFLSKEKLNAFVSEIEDRIGAENISQKFLANRLDFEGKLKKEGFFESRVSFFGLQDWLRVYSYEEVKDAFKLEGEPKPGEAYYFSSKKELNSELDLMGVKTRLIGKNNPNIWHDSNNSAETFLALVVPKADFNKFHELYKSSENGMELKSIFAFTFKEANKDKKIALAGEVIKSFRGSSIFDSYSKIAINVWEFEKDIISMYGSLLYCGILMGMTFLATMIMIVFYKQISEGFEDKKRFAILKRIGLCAKESKKMIARQVVWVFFLPLVVAFIHASLSIKISGKVLMLLGLSNMASYEKVCMLTYIVYALTYLAIYLLSSRGYYALISSEEE